ncbi:MAG TPA: hybrid sensor histidine kinase/response regulator [Candidatus Acidoferrales bacterium]|jgi:two-component system sensor histidine kinase and response regulator WspE|nr:hybrid sensor histidine kinase/response regulator [Candidatus Acidoferrales bacterium]
MSNLGAFSMWDLFRGEVESQMRVFTEGLLQIEGGANPQAHLAATMRAAHSIKGAARIVQLDVVVRLTHLMEDCLVAAQESTLLLNAAGVDVLLAAGDLLSRLSSVDEASVPVWIEEHGAAIEELLTHLAQVRAGTWTSPTNGTASAPKSSFVTTESADSPAASSGEVAGLPAKGIPANVAPSVPAAETSAPPPPVSEKPAASSHVVDMKDRTLKVGAHTLNRLMGLAGESLVQSRWFEPFAESLFTLKRRQYEISEILELLQTRLDHAPGDANDLLDSARSKLETVRQSTAARHMEFETFALRSSGLSDRLYREVVATRMRPFGDVVEGFPRLVRDLARQLGKQAQITILGRQTEVDREILDRLDAPLNHMIRNSLDHGIESPEERLAAGKSSSGTIRVEARHRAGLFVLTVSDDGRGVNVERLRMKVVDRGHATPEMAANFSDAELTEFLFLPGFSTASKVTDISGRGVGLDAVNEMAKSVGGVARLTAPPGQGITLTLELPLTLSVVRTLVAEIGGEPFAFPLTRIAKTVSLPFPELVSLEGQQYFTLDGERIGVVPAHELLGMPRKPEWGEEIPVLLLGERAERYGLAVDRFLGEHDMVVRPLDRRLGKVQDVSASALMEDGSPVLILDVEDLIRSVQTELQGGRLRGLGQAAVTAVKRRRILVVDDSITVRELERSLLKSRGYEVEVAVDGMDGWNALRSGSYDLMVTDVDMPRMTGIELVSRVKADPHLRAIPVIIVSYKDREEDRLRGLEAGADRYMTKSSFHDQTLLSAVHEFIGPPG